jgi:hypothetical protein
VVQQSLPKHAFSTLFKPKLICFAYRTRKAEIDLLTAPTEGDGLDEFYVRLKKIQDYHARYPNQVTNPFELELNEMLEDVEEVENEEFEDNNRKHLRQCFFCFAS